MSTGITTINNLVPELPLQASEDFLSTPMFNLIYNFGADLHFADAHLGRTLRMSRMERLSTDGGELNGSGIDPAPEVPVRSDIDATTKIYAKTITINEQVTLFENSKTLTRFVALLGQWMREKENLLMRDLYASSVSYINAVGGVNGDQPSNMARADWDNVERILLSNDARTVLENIEAQDKFGTGPTRDAFLALCDTDLTADLQGVSGVLLKNAYPLQAGLRPEEYCSISRSRVFVSSRGIKVANSSLNGNDVYSIPIFGVEAVSKIEQNGYSSKVGYRPPWVVSRAAQNYELYAKFAFAAAITNQNWISGLNTTLKSV